MRVFIYLLILITANLTYSQDVFQERRALWVVRDALDSKAKIDKLIKTAMITGISDFFVQVRARGLAYYQTEIEPMAAFISQDYDPLYYVLKKAKLYNIKVHAWVNMFYIWSGSREPADQRHAYHRFRRQILRRERFPSYRSLRNAGIEGYFLDPQNKQVQKYLLNLLHEIADTYNVAGIHLDYFRYPGVEYSFTAESRTNFRLSNHFDPLPIYMETEQYAQDRGYEVFLHADREYRNTLREKLSQYLQSIAVSLAARNEAPELSVAVKPDPAIAKFRYFQDWLTWLADDICDIAVIMNYTTDLGLFTAIISRLDGMTDKNKIMVGISTYNQDEQAVNERLALVRKKRYSGFSLFSFNHLLDNKYYIKKLNLLQ